MKLQSLRIEPVGPTGWKSPELKFGDEITQLFGPNGCGKTPVIQSIAYALGYPVKFRDDIYQNCNAVTLVLRDGSRSYVIRRQIANQLSVQVTLPDGHAKSFYNELDYSRYLFDLWGFTKNVLTSGGNDPVEAYIATLLPLFYLDQDHGYVNAYRPPTFFIKDQYAEMMRLMFGFPPKHSYDQKKQLHEKRDRLDQVDRRIVRAISTIENIGKELGNLRRPSEQAKADGIAIREQLTALRDSRSIKSDARNAIESLIYDKRALQRALQREIAEVQTRVEGFQSMQDEIETEINTLSLNEEARRVFSTFKDICSNGACGLFLGSSESYGKSLLYLRDQVKDLHRNTEARRARIDEMVEKFNQAVDEIADLEAKRANLETEEDVDGLVTTTSELTKKLIDLQKEYQNLTAIEAEETQYVELLNQRDALHNEIEALTTSASATDLRLLETRNALRARIAHWLDVLKTRNVSREVSVDADFNLLFGNEKITQFHGSTLTRVVLAIHTAAFELYVHDKNRKLRFLILDTPRQQDIELAALAQYIAEMKKLASSYKAQVIFSSTEYHYQCTDGDQEWTPEFPGLEQKMFLGTPNQTTST